MRTKITTPQYGYLTVTHDDGGYGPETTTIYFVSLSSSGKPSYVRIADDVGRFPQVCEYLSNRGNTLMATPETLATVIRTELRRARDAARRERGR